MAQIDPKKQAEIGEIGALIREYNEWNRAQGLSLGSADEHLFDENLTDAQRAWLNNFCDRWGRSLTKIKEG